MRTLGPVADCTECASLNDADLYMKPDVAWIADETLLGADLSRDLQRILRNRPSDGKQFFVSLVPGVGNPDFAQELAYSGIKLPDAGLQILALYRFWSIIQYWYPNRDIVGENWAGVLAEFIPESPWPRHSTVTSANSWR